MRRWLWVPIVVVSLAALGWAWWREPPTVVRGLPAGQVLVYVNWRPLRQAQLLSGGAAGEERAGSYAAFVRESGFDFERDLDAIGISMEGSPLAPRDATVILEGRFGPQFTAYLHQHALSQEGLDGTTAYRFPGWARPQQTLTVVPLSRHEVLVTNAGDAAAIVERTQRWWNWGVASPEIWEAGSARMLVGYAGVNTQELAAEGALDGSRPPLAGLERVTVRVSAGMQGVTLNATAPAHSGAAAAAAAAWLQNLVQGLRREGPEGENPTLAQLQVGQRGTAVWLRWRLEAAQLAQWRKRMLEAPAAARP